MMALALNLGRKFLNPKYADLHIRCGEKTFRVHRAVVCSASEVMAMEVDDAVIEGTVRVIDHTRFDADTMDKMFQFLYREDYTFDPTDSMAPPTSDDDIASMAMSLLVIDETNSSEDLNRLITHFRVQAIAKHYELADLEQVAVSKFSLELQAQIPLSTEDLLAVAEVVYGTPSDATSDMQQEVLSSAFNNHKEYLGQPAFVGAIVERPDLRQFAVNFFEGITSVHETEIANVVQDFRTEIEKLQGELSNKKQGLTQEMLSKKVAYEHALSEKEKWHEYAKRISSEKTQIDAELQASREKWEQIQRKLTDELRAVRVQNTTLETDLKLARHDNTALEAKQKLHLANSVTQAEHNDALAATRVAEQVKTQLLELNNIEFCRHCSTNLYCNFERYGPNGYLARCIDCGTRHFAGPNNGAL